MELSAALQRPVATEPPLPLVELDTLYDVSQALAGAATLHQGLAETMQLLRRFPGALRGSLTLLDEETRELYIEAALELPEAGRLVRYRLGEGITGEVVATGRPIVVPDVEQEPRFLHRTVRRTAGPGQEVSFVCVPILLDHRPIGALSVDLPHRTSGDAARLVKFLHVVSALVALRLKTQRPLEEENRLLRQELQERYDLTHLIERAVIVCDGPAIHGRHLPPTLQTPGGTEAFSGTLKSAVERLEADLLVDALKSARGSVAEATRLLSSTERIVRYKLRKYGIEPTRFA